MLSLLCKTQSKWRLYEYGCMCIDNIGSYITLCVSAIASQVAWRRYGRCQPGIIIPKQHIFYSKRVCVCVCVCANVCVCVALIPLNTNTSPMLRAKTHNKAAPVIYL